MPVLILVALLFPIALSAQTTADHATLPSHTLSLLSLNAGAPLQVSLSGGFAYSRKGFVSGQHGVMGSAVFASVEPGLGGIKVNAGYMDAMPMGGLSVQATVVRTWRDAWQVERNNTYAGAEGSVRLGPFRVGLGLCKRTAGTGAEWLVPVTVGLGLP